MIKDKVGKSVEYFGVIYTVGAAVTVAKGSDYDGLVGVIKEITTSKII